MITFSVVRLQLGREGEPYRYSISVQGVTVTPRTRTVRFPARVEGLPITHIGYSQTYVPAHKERMPSGEEHEVGGEYAAKMRPLELPKAVKKIYIPATVTDIAPYAFDGVAKDAVFEVAKSNPRYTARCGKLCYKNA